MGPVLVRVPLSGHARVARAVLLVVAARRGALGGGAAKGSPLPGLLALLRRPVPLPAGLKV